MKFALILLGSFIGLTYQATTTHPHHQPHDNAEHESFSFFYDSHSGQMVVHYNNKIECYIFPLTDAEKALVHTETGLRHLEIQIIGMIDTATKREVRKEVLDARIIHACGHTAAHYYVMS